MKKITKLVAVSAAAMTFGITGVSALNNTNIVNADNASDIANLNNQIESIKNGKFSYMINNRWIGYDARTVSDVATSVENGTANDFKDSLSSKTYGYLGQGEQKDNATVEKDTLGEEKIIKVDSNDASGMEQAASLGKATEKVLADFYGSNAQPATQSSNNSNKQNANANKQTANNDNKQNTNNSNAQNANNNNNANAQNNSSSKKADVAANANNNNVKSNNAQGAVANKQNTNNEANAQQNTVKSNANVEGAKTVANENESNSTKNQNNGAIAETQNENTTAAGETSTVVKAQAKSASNSAAQKNNTPVFPQTGEQTSEILAVAGGLIIAATAAGIVVYKKRN